MKLVEKSGISSNLLVLDEFLDTSLDYDGNEKTIELLKQFKEKNVIIISHNTDIKNLLDYNRHFEIKDELGFAKMQKIQGKD